MPVNNDLEDSLPRAPFLFGAVTALVLAIHLAFVVVAARDLPRTTDENLYVQTARVALAEGNWDDPEMRFQGPFGLVFNQILIGDRWTPETKAEISDEILFRARLGMVLFSILSLLGVAYWTRTLFGDRAGAIAAVAYGLHPMVIGYGALVNVDMAHAALTLLTAWCTARFVTHRRWSDLVCTGIALGLAVGTKYLALGIAPFVGVLVLIGAARKNKSQAGFTVPAAAVLLLGATFATLHAVYLFRSGFAFDFEPQSSLFTRAYEVPGFSYFAGLLPFDFLGGVDRLLAFDSDRTVFFLGEFVENPASYYPVSVALKSPPSVLAIGLCGVAAWVFGRKRLSSQARWAGIVLFTLIVFPILFLTYGSSFKVGIRYIMQFAPLAAVGIGALGLVLDRWTTRLVCLLLAVSCLPVLFAWGPNHIAYINVFGTRDGVVRPDLFADSNAEWMQNVERGPELLRERYGDKITILRGSDTPRFGLVAAYLPDLTAREPGGGPGTIHWLTDFQPIAAIDSAWWVYSVTSEQFAEVSASASNPRLHGWHVAALIDDGQFEAARAKLELVPKKQRDLMTGVLDFFEGTKAVSPMALAGDALAAGYPEWALQFVQSDDVPDLAAAVWIHSRALVASFRLEEAIEVLQDSPHSVNDPRLALTLVHLLVRTWRIDEARAAVDAQGPELQAVSGEWYTQVIELLERRERLRALTAGK